MTDEARALGLKKSQFRNATGLFHPEHQVTARELALVARHLIREYPEHYPLFALKDYTWARPSSRTATRCWASCREPMASRRGIYVRLDTGSSRRRCRTNRRLIVVVNGLAAQEERRDEARKLLEWGFKDLRRGRLFDAGRGVGRAPACGAPALQRAARWAPGHHHAGAAVGGAKGRGARLLHRAAEATGQEGRPGGHACAFRPRRTRAPKCRSMPRKT